MSHRPSIVTPMATTQAQIAEKLGLSRSTVAAALNPRSTVKLKAGTRERIRAEADSLGYRPHRYAQIMRAGASGFIGLFHFGGLSQVAAERAWHASRAVQAAGYQIWFSDASWAAGGVKAACEAMLDARVEGVIVAGLNDPASVSELALLQRARIPMVTLSGNALPHTPHIRADARDAFERLTAHLVANGRRRLLLLFSLTRRIQQGAYIWAGLERREGFRAGLRAAGGGEVERFSRRMRGIEGAVLGLDFVSDPFDPFRHAYEVVRRACSSHAGFDAIICGNDDWAIGAMAALAESGVSVPDDVAVTGFDNTAVGAYLDVPLTSVAQPSGPMAEHAVELLGKKIRGQRISSRVVKFPCELVIRRSCGTRSQPKMPPST